MDKYAVSLKKDMVEQFRGKPNIEVLMDALAVQLQEVYDFYRQIETMCSLDTAVGKQLDGVGDIVVLSRAEASQLAGFTKNPEEVIDDDNYRKYLIFKVLKNTCDCTYPDIIKAFRMFWDGPLYYSEDPEKPATMVFDSGILTPEDHAEDLLSAPIVKAAGVGIHILATTETPEISGGCYLNAVMGQGLMTNILPTLEPAYSFEAKVVTEAAMVYSCMTTDLQTIGIDFTDTERAAVCISGVSITHKLIDLEQER